MNHICRINIFRPFSVKGSPGMYTPWTRSEVYFTNVTSLRQAEPAQREIEINALGRKFSKCISCELLHDELIRGLELKTKMSETRSDLAKGGQEVQYSDYITPLDHPSPNRFNDYEHSSAAPRRPAAYSTFATQLNRSSNPSLPRIFEHLTS